MSISPKKERFLDEALKVIHEKGFKATTMRDLAERMGCEVSNIYNFIDSKQNLLENYLFDISEAFHDGIDQIIDSSYSSVEKLRSVIGLHVNLTVTRPFEVALLVNEWRNLNDEKKERFIKLRSGYQEKLNSIIQEGVDDKSIKANDINISSHVILSSVRWVYSWYTENPKAYNPIELQRQISSIVLEGLSE